MSVLGIDLGTSFCVLGTITRGSVTIVRNDLSERLTPALVSYTDRQRLIGEAALSGIKSNFSNTARNIKNLLGASDPTTLEEEQLYALAPLVIADLGDGIQQISYQVNYKGQSQLFSPTQVLAALFSKLREIGEKSNDAVVTDIVVSAPGWLGESGRQAILDASALANLNCLSVLSEHAAVALDYGIFRSSSFHPKEKSRVAFVNVGHGTACVAVADFLQGEFEIVATASDKHLGGRNFDRVIMQHFASEFQQKHGINPLSKGKMMLKLEDAAGKAKKILSANSEAPFNVECLWEEHDICGLVTREHFETLCAPYMNRLSELLRETFVSSGIDPATVQSVEIVGGSTRIPWVQRTISEFFNGMPVSKTLNMDEAVARGCALQAAMLNPRYVVRNFEVRDKLQWPVSITWTINESQKTTVLFEKGTCLGTKKSLTFNRSTDFEMTIIPSSPGDGPMTVYVKTPQTDLHEKWERKFKVKVRISHSGIIVVDSAQLFIDYEAQDDVITKRRVPAPSSSSAEGDNESSSGATPAGASESATPDGHQNEAGAEVPGAAPADPSSQAAFVEESVQEKVKRWKTARLDCPVDIRRVGFAPQSLLSKWKQNEVAMREEDKTIQEAMDLVNSLEAHIFSMRDRISGDGELVRFLEPGQFELISSKLQEAEDWVMSNYDCHRDVIKKYFDEVKAVSNPVEFKLRAEQEAIAAEQRRIEADANEARRKEAEAAAAAAQAAAAAAAPKDQPDAGNPADPKAATGTNEAKTTASPPAQDPSAAAPFS